MKLFIFLVLLFNMEAESQSVEEERSSPGGTIWYGGENYIPTEGTWGEGVWPEGVLRHGDDKDYIPAEGTWYGAENYIPTEGTWYGGENYIPTEGTWGEGVWPKGVLRHGDEDHIPTEDTGYDEENSIMPTESIWAEYPWAEGIWHTGMWAGDANSISSEGTEYNGEDTD